MKDTITIGMDLGDRNHIVVVLDTAGEQILCDKVVNTKTALKRFFQPYEGATVAIETSTHSPWISRLLEELGCQVYVGNPHKLRVIWDSTDKSDARDARMLAMIARLEPKLLWPIRHRDVSVAAPAVGQRTELCSAQYSAVRKKSGLKMLWRYLIATC